MINENDRLRLPVTMKMSDDRELTGDMIVNVGGTLDRSLNNETRYILFGDPDGSERMIAKSCILEVVAHKRNRDGSVQMRQPGKVQASTSQAAAVDTQDAAKPSIPTSAHEILGIAPTASDAEIQNAFVEKVGAYHPDRFKGAHLPDEVSDYIDTMSRRIHDAYKQLMKDKAPVLSAHMMPPVARTG